VCVCVCRTLRTRTIIRRLNDESDWTAFCNWLGEYDQGGKRSFWRRNKIELKTDRCALVVRITRDKTKRLSDVLDARIRVGTVPNGPSGEHRRVRILRTVSVAHRFVIGSSSRHVFAALRASPRTVQPSREDLKIDIVWLSADRLADQNVVTKKMSPTGRAVFDPTRPTQILSFATTVSDRPARRFNF